MLSNPERSIAATVIAQSDIRAERLISVLRMLVAATLFLGVTFILSQSEAAGLDARRFELLGLLAGSACYFLLGALNFYFATEARLKPWMRWAFNLGEIALVSIQLYLDVADPATPSLLAFASPVMLVVALVVCVQVLRFQIGLHIVSTGLLIVLCGLIVFHDPQIDTPLSPEAVHELQLLYTVPPNIMRLVMLTAMAILIGTAVFRSRRLIERVARETEVAENRKRFLPAEISDSMSDEKLDALRLGEERKVAVLFADIRDFTSISEKIGARQTAEMLSRYRALVTDVMVRNNGVVDKFIGDGALVVFGLHSDIAQACAEAIDAANGLRLSIESWNDSRAGQKLDRLRIAIGVHSGPAVIGAIGDDRRLEFTAVGNTINVASRLEEIAKQRDLSLVVSNRTAKTAGIDGTDYLSLGPLSIRGSTEPMDLLGRR